LRDFTNARAALDRALEIEPDSISLLGLKAQTYQNEGNLPEAARLLQRIPVRSEDFYNFTIHIDQLLYERRFDEVVRIVDSALSKPADDLVSIHAYCRIVLGSVQAWLGKNVESRSNFQVALKAGLRVRKSQADDVQLAQFFAVVYAGLGDEQNAVAMAKRNIELNADDSLALPQAQILLAWVQSVFSDKAAAVAAMPHLLEVPAGLTIAELRMHPKWDALRADLNFQKLVASPPAD
jgi:tetratricopeptide (TPR) repeat protein